MEDPRGAVATSEPIVLRATGLSLAQAFRDEKPNYDSMADWEREGRRRFGLNKLGWAWTCHHCLTSFRAADYALRGAPQAKIGFACLGAYEKSIPCNYDGTNRVPSNPITIRLPGGVTAHMLAFKD